MKKKKMFLLIYQNLDFSVILTRDVEAIKNYETLISTSGA